MRTESPIKLGIDSTLLSEGFQHKAGTWYREREESILVVNLQKSNFGEQYYINLGVLLKGPQAVNIRLPPKEHECHVRLRVEAATPAEEQALTSLLNLEDWSIDAADRERRVQALIAARALPFLLQCSTRDGLRQAHRDGKLSGAVVHKAIRESLQS
jgi:hypothetical protein